MPDDATSADLAKTCPRCKTQKPLTAYYADPQRTHHTDPRQRVRPWCKACHYQSSLVRRRDGEYRFWANVSRGLRHRHPDSPTATVLRAGLGEPTHCTLCGLPLTRTQAVVDHVLPVSRGGASVLKNLAWTHRACNALKGPLTIAELRRLVRSVADHLDATAGAPEPDPLRFEGSGVTFHLDRRNFNRSAGAPALR